MLGEVGEHTGTFPVRILEHLLKEGRSPKAAARAQRGRVRALKCCDPKVIPDTATTQRFIKLFPHCQPSGSTRSHSQNGIPAGGNPGQAR